MFIKKRIHLISILMIIVAIVLLCEVAIANSISAENFGKVVGQRLIPLLLISLIFRRYPKVFLCSSILFLSLSVYAFYLSHDQRVKDAQMAKSMNEIDQIYQLTGNNDAKSIPPKNYSSSEYGVLAPLLNIAKEASEFSNKQEKLLEQAIERVDFENIISPEKMGNQEGIVSSIEKLNALSKFLDESESEKKHYVQKFEAQINSQISDIETKESFLKGFRDSANNGFLLTNYYQVLRDYIREYKSLLRFMKFISGSYWFEDQEMVFEYKTDLQIFDGYIFRLAELGKKEQQVLNQMKTQRNSNVQIMKNFKNVR